VSDALHVPKNGMVCAKGEVTSPLQSAFSALKAAGRAQGRCK